MALDYFEPYIDSDIEPDWLTDWNLFRGELISNFGSINPEDEAEIALENVKFPDNGKASKFFIEFAKYASHVAYDDRSLRRIAYKALPARIKDHLVEITPTPHTFNELKAVVLSLDAHYWEYKKEKAATNAPPTSQKPHNNSGNSGNSGGQSSMTTSQEGPLLLFLTRLPKSLARMENSYQKRSSVELTMDSA